MNSFRHGQRTVSREKHIVQQVNVRTNAVRGLHIVAAVCMMCVLARAKAQGQTVTF